MSPPNLFLIGAAKAGSSTLAFHLRDHPEIGMAAKEPNIFNQPDLAACRHRLEAFAHNGLDQRWILDGSVNYTQYPKFGNVPQNIAALTDPGAIRFLYMLRNPVDRMISQYFWRRERFGENRSLEDACAPDSLYIMSSRYDVQLRRFLDVFDRDQFRIVKHETYFGDVVPEFAALCRWLGISETHVPDATLKRGATQKQTTRDARFPLLNRMLRASPRLKRQITARLPYRYQKRLSGLLSRTTDRPAVSAEQRRFLCDRLSGSIDETERLTGLDLSDWRA